MKNRYLIPYIAALSILLAVGCTDSSHESEGESMQNTQAESSLSTDAESKDTNESTTGIETSVQSETDSESETETQMPLPATVAFDKTEYRVGEEILLRVTGEPDDTVAFFPAAYDALINTPIYYASLGTIAEITQGDTICVTALPGQHRNDATVAFYYGVLPIGDYKAVVFAGEGEVCAEAKITIVYGSDDITTGAELAARCLDVALNYKTLYVNGCFGAPMTEKNKTRYTQNTAYNRLPERTALINAASAETFGFDCVCFIKGILWGWNGTLDHVYGGAAYQANGVPDIGENTMIERCSAISKDFSAIEVGEAVWIDGHIGIYIGNGLAVECTPSWQDGVQITACNTRRRGFQRRNWTKHGKLPYVEYDGVYESVTD